MRFEEEEEEVVGEDVEVVLDVDIVVDIVASPPLDIDTSSGQVVEKGLNHLQHSLIEWDMIKRKYIYVRYHTYPKNHSIRERGGGGGEVIQSHFIYKVPNIDPTNQPPARTQSFQN